MYLVGQTYYYYLQGDPNQNFSFPRPRTLRLSTSDSKLEMPKLVWQMIVFVVEIGVLKKEWKIKKFP